LCLLHHAVCVKGPFLVVSDAEELHPRCRLCGWGALSLPSPVVHDQLLCFVDVEGEVTFLAPLYQGSHLLSAGRLYLLVIRPNTVVSSANLIELEKCVGTQS
jgi:hypothetical protein